MAGFDVSDVAAHVAVPQQTNPFQTVEGLANLQNSLNQNKMFQAKALAGQYLQQTVGQDGLPDLGQLNKFLQSDPRTAAFSPEIMQDAANLRGTMLTNQQTQYAVHTGEMDRAMGAIAAAYSQDPKQAAQALDTLVNAGVISPQTRALPQFSTPEGLAEAQQRAIMSGGSQQEQDALVGKTQIVPLGGTNQGVNVRTIPGQGAVITKATGNAANLANTLSAHDLAVPVETTDPATGAKTMGTLGDYIDPTTGQWKSGVAHPLTALGPLSANALGALGANYGPQIAAFEKTVGAAPQTRQLIENLRAEEPQFGQGPQSDFAMHLGELLSQFGIKPTQPVSNDETAAREASRKNLLMLMGAQQHALGMDQTDAARQMATAAVPSSATTPEGFRQIMSVVEGNNDALQAAGKVWEAQKAKGGPASWGQFQMQFASRVPPSIFQSQYMTPAQITQMQKGWSSAKIADWNARRANAKKHGWLPNEQ